MNIIINEYIIEDKKLVIEQDVKHDDYIFRVMNKKTLITEYISAPIGGLVAARAKGFAYMGVQS